MLRTLGQWVSKARAMAREFQDGLEDMARETGLDEAKREIETATGDIGGMIEKSIDPDAELKGAFDPDHPLPDEDKDDAPQPGEAGAEADAGAKTPEGDEPGDKESQADEHGGPAKGGG